MCRSVVLRSNSVFPRDPGLFCRVGVVERKHVVRVRASTHTTIDEKNDVVARRRSALATENFVANLVESRVSELEDDTGRLNRRQ